MLRKTGNIRVFLVYLAALVLGLPSISGLSACGTSGLRADEDDDYYGEDDGEDDEERPRRRKRRRRPRSNAPILVKLRRLPDAVVEKSRTGRPTEDIEELRSSLCDGREDVPKIFYQLIVSGRWHYYWICSDTKVQRAATPEGNRMLLAWVNRLKRRGEVESAACSPGDRRRLLNQSHESGTRAKIYCDGRIVLRFADGGTKTRTFTVARTTATAAPPAPDGRSVCPTCPVCPTVQTHRVDCPKPRAPCPPPPRCPRAKVCPTCPACPACDCRTKMRKAGEKGFWQGVEKACKRICTLIYKKCRSINPNTALCYQVSEYCAGTCAKK